MPDMVGLECNVAHKTLSSCNLVCCIGRRLRIVSVISILAPFIRLLQPFDVLATSRHNGAALYIDCAAQGS